MQDFKKYRFLFILLCIFHNGMANPRIDPLVETNSGLIRGLRSADGTYSMFMGIPYATVDEANPFGASIPHPGFDEVFEAYDDSAICPQVEEFNDTIVGSLDCLHLNVYVPNSASSRNRLPVLVWIYGGGFSIGFSGRYLYGPSFLVRHDIILVTINYRLGPYGFMCLDTPKIPGNQGLKDQHLALKWIKNHIESFGGDNDKITIFGESAGSVSVDLHLYYNQESLFNKAILQSGTTGTLAISESNTENLLNIANYLGFPSSDVEEALTFLSTVDTKLVIAATSELDVGFGPCVEKEFDGIESFITQHPLNIDVPRVANTPILIGHNNDEGVTHVLSLLEEDLIHDYLVKYFNFDESQRFEMERLVKHFYMGDEGINDKSIWPLADFDSDFTFNYPTQRSIEKYLRNGAQSVYQYMFSYNGGRNFVKNRLNMTEGGAAHADEIGYLFDISYMKDKPSPEDQQVIDQLTTLWTNFVKYGNPTPETTELLPVTWTPVTEDTSFYLNIDSELSLERRPFHARMAFWDLFYKLNEPLQKGYQDNE